MSLFEKHLEGIASVIIVEKATEQLLVSDFAIIRNYLMDLLKQNATFNYVLAEEKYFGTAFDNTFVLDLSRIFTFEVNFAGKNSPYLHFRKVYEVASKLNSTEKHASFFGPNHYLSGERITCSVRNQLAVGLASSGCFVRGHRGDIYELELINQPRWNELIVVKVICEYGTILIDFNVLIKVAKTLAPSWPKPHPMKNAKSQWLAAADMRTKYNIQNKHNKQVFSLRAPLLETAVTAYTSFPLALRLCAQLLRKWNLCMLNIFLSSAFYEEYLYYYETNRHLKASIADIIVAVLQRMYNYFRNNNFPYYWDTRINLLTYFSNYPNKIAIFRRLVAIRNRIENFTKDPTLTCESVEEYFGIHIDSLVLKIDDFGIYASF